MVTRTLADYLVGAKLDAVPADVRHEARRALVNIVGCAVGGAPHPAVDIAIKTFEPFSGPRTAAILGRSERLDPLHAALINGVTSHVEDYDDTLPKNYIHATTPVASALFAYASVNEVSGEDFVNAFILGFETVARIGNATYPAHYDVGWHSTGSVGVMGAAAAIGKLRGLDAERMVWAIGLAATQSAGIREMFGSMAKGFHPGRAAQNGYGAALLAENGFTSGPRGIEGPRGFASVLSTDFDPGKITDGLGESFELMVNTYKPFPCGIVNHPTIDACIQLKREHGFDASEIRAVRLRVAPLVMDLCAQRDITKGLQGKFSVYHGAAVGLVRGKAGLPEYTDAGVNDPAIKRVRELVAPTGDPSVTEDGVRVEVEFADGRVLTKTLEHSLGNLERPMSDAQLDEKFVDQVGLVLPEAQTKRLLDLCWRIDELDQVSDIAAASLPPQ